MVETVGSGVSGLLPGQLPLRVQLVWWQTAKTMRSNTVSTSSRYPVDAEPSSTSTTSRRLSAKFASGLSDPMNGRAIANALVEELGHESVMYVGLPTHPQHDLARRQMSGFGGMISIELGSRERAAYLLRRVRVFSLAESLGGVESLISHPATMTHASVTPELRLEMGISDGLVRLSCGVEDTDDLLADLEQALQGMPEGGRRAARREKASVS